jgi:hypothetical protein
MNDEQDILLLENILNELGIDMSEARKPFSNLSSKAQVIGKELIKMTLKKTVIFIL